MVNVFGATRKLLVDIATFIVKFNSRPNDESYLIEAIRHFRLLSILVMLLDGINVQLTPIGALFDDFEVNYTPFYNEVRNQVDDLLIATEDEFGPGFAINVMAMHPAIHRRVVDLAFAIRRVHQFVKYADEMLYDAGSVAP